MIRFDSDYTEGAHSSVINMLTQTNLEQTIGYSEDEYCDKARLLIKEACKAENSDVHFLVGGTQTNATVISALLKPYQGVISPSSGHINVHETGAIEAYGHKVIALKQENGKIVSEDIENYVTAHYADEAHEHIVQPGAVYISHPTETGTLYSKEELSKIYSVCKKYGLYLFIDGARLGYALGSEYNDVFLSDLPSLCDVFYIGGTKCGMLFGEAVVINNDSIKKDFRYYIKQHGGMLAKGRLLGLQYIVLFEDGLYTEICAKADTLALKIKKELEKVVPFFALSYTNQQFPILPDKTIDALSDKYAFSYWCRIDDSHSAVRICTSWATKEETVDTLIKDIKDNL